MHTLKLQQAAEIIEVALAHARDVGCPPMTVAVLDPGGHLLALQREDRSGILRPQIAQAKAWGALGMGHGSRFLAGRAEAAPAFFAALTDISAGRIAPVPGGVLIRDSDGNILGAVGVSGDLPDRDETCAVAGIDHLGLVADVG
ncbi:heme-binding protein [Pseudomonas sp. RIT-PI-S]|uniref:GlcG/HbpS family heme-binding protein n=1 Tax=Pseudomonas sp. RIT-PI-S TaxID=3035295 RepID=UPI0021D95078|nr:heme-binding protein [Pseudomonas sp. RIT-PI-S]